MNLNLYEKLKTGLTPQEKIDCYEKAIDELKLEGRPICYVLMECFEDVLSVKMVHICKLFPEFYLLKPISRDAHYEWFNSTEERIQVLNKLIEEQKKLL